LNVEPLLTDLAHHSVDNVSLSPTSLSSRESKLIKFSCLQRVTSRTLVLTQMVNLATRQTREEAEEVAEEDREVEQNQGERIEVERKVEVEQGQILDS